MDQVKPYHPRLPAGPPIEGDVLPYLGGAIGRYRAPAGMFAGAFEGIMGDPQLATAETGEKVYGLVTDWITEVIRRDWAAAHGAGRARASRGAVRQRW